MATVICQPGCFPIKRALLLWLWAGNALAIDKLSLGVASLAAQGWRIEGARIELSNQDAGRRQLALTIDKLTLPKPFDDLQLLDVRCLSLQWEEAQIACERGRASVASKHWHSPRADFSFRFGGEDGRADIANLRLFGGALAGEFHKQGARWRFKLKGEKIGLALLQKQLDLRWADVHAGTAGARLTAAGDAGGIRAADAAVDVDRLTLQTADGKTAAEGLSATLKLAAHTIRKHWQWRIEQRLTGGALYQEPIYLDAGNAALTANGQGVWRPKRREIEIKALRVAHAGVAEAQGRATLDLRAGLALSKAEASLETNDLQRFAAVYLQPFAAQTAFDGVSGQGRARAELAADTRGLTRLALDFSKLALDDPAGRIGVKGGRGSLRWARAASGAPPSSFSWQTLSLFALPFDAAELKFTADGRRVELANKTRLPLLGGALAIDAFSWQSNPDDEPNVYFAGALQDISLERLTKALGWTPLSGTLGGHIPGVAYRDKTLQLGGALNIDVFDGNVTIANLASSGLFGDFPKLSADIEVNRLDLEQLTGKFQFGGITGRLSGYVKNLLLENWRPVGFDAWFGSPDDDDSPHRISQKAVKNIANIGGGGASDLLSRGFLSFFETFGYDKIGLGCRLREGVCQMSGVEAVQSGYSIIKGGGLPRIDVIGYNPKVDWSVLMERLKRVTTSDEVIIK